MTAFPDWLEPMAATLTQERFTGPEWMFERKLDGIRLLAFKHGARRPAALAQPAAAAPARRRRGDRANCRCSDVILDGEVDLAVGASEPAITSSTSSGSTARDVTPLPLEERRALLDGAAASRRRCSASRALDGRRSRGSAPAPKAGKA